MHFDISNIKCSIEVHEMSVCLRLTFIRYFSQKIVWQPRVVETNTIQAIWSVSTDCRNFRFILWDRAVIWGGKMPSAATNIRWVHLKNYEYSVNQGIIMSDLHLGWYRSAPAVRASFRTYRFVGLVMNPSGMRTPWALESKAVRFHGQSLLYNF